MKLLSDYYSYTALIKDDSNGTKLAVAVYGFITVDLKLT